MIHAGDIMSTVGVFNAMGYSNDKRFPPTVLNTPRVHNDTPHDTESPPRYSRYTPTVLNTTMVLSTPHRTEHTLYRVRVGYHTITIHTVQKVKKPSQLVFWCESSHFF